jgi:hypothetical protein
LNLWRPQPGPQTQFVKNRAFEVIYGGARGGGKTDAVLGEFGLHAMRHGRHARGLMVRRTRTALEPTIDRAREIYAPQGARWCGKRSRFEWRSGASLAFRHLDNDADANKYQGHSYTRVYVEELTQFPSPGPVDKLKGALRSAAGVRCAFRATCNPGGAGHAWVKARYIDAGPLTEVVEGGLARVFIPARVADNPALFKADPTYLARLKLTGSAALVRAWLEGDWDAVEGAFFDSWSRRNIIMPFTMPTEWTRIRSFDWGFASPFSVGWWAVVGDNTPNRDPDHPIAVLPCGAMIRYREWYGQGPDGKGLRIPTEAIAGGILDRERAAGDTIRDAVADPSIFSHGGGPSLDENMAAQGCSFRKADNTRVGEFGALSGWDQMRARILGEDGVPMLYVFDTCREFIRTVPALQHDPQRLEDVDTRGEDHIADETRYACLARPLTVSATGSIMGGLG